VVYTIPPAHGIFWTLFLAFAFFFIGTGISRLVHARKLKTLIEKESPTALPTGKTQYIGPSQAVYETDDLAGRPLSVTEHTTRQLEMNPKTETKH
jgi:hypothetical protein